MDAFGIPLDAPVGQEAREEVGNLMRVFHEIDAELTSDHLDRRRWQQHDRLARLMAGGEEVGNAALQAYTSTTREVPYAVRRALLWVGGSASPENARALLSELYLGYGYPIEDRTEACLVLAESSPEHFLELTAPKLQLRERRSETLPKDEFLVEGWIAACERTDRSPVPMLADVMINRRLDPEARWRAAKRIREFEREPIGIDALNLCLIESSGDGMLRRMSAQSLRDLLPGEEGCALFVEVLSRESDVNFRQFLVDMIQDNCRHLVLDDFLDADQGPAGPLPRIGGDSVGADGSGIGEPGAGDGDGR